jgi:hypothetical protein
MRLMKSALARSFAIIAGCCAISISARSAAQAAPDPRSCRPLGAWGTVCPGSDLGPNPDSRPSGQLTPQASIGAESWSTIRTNAPPAPRFWASSVFAESLNAMIVFAGRQNAPGPWFGDTWALDIGSSRWRLLGARGPSSPAGRDRSSVVYDSDRNRLVIYGGFSGYAGYVNDVWSLDFRTQEWTEVATAGTPPHDRESHAAFYDAARHRMIVFGGEYWDGSSWHILTDLWSLNLDTMEWAELSPTGEPPPTTGHASAYDPARGILYVYGGADLSINYFSDRLWRLNVRTLEWSDSTSAGNNPGPRDDFSLVYDPTADRLIMYGGHSTDGTSGAFYDSVWALTISSMVWTEIVPSGEAPHFLFGHTAVHDGRTRMYSWGGLIDVTPECSDKTFSMKRGKTVDLSGRRSKNR